MKKHVWMVLAGISAMCALFGAFAHDLFLLLWSMGLLAYDIYMYEHTED